MADLTTIDDYKDFMGITSNKEDVPLALLVTSVSALVKSYCGRSFVDYAASDKTEYITIEDDVHSIALEEFPVISITSVEERYGYSADYTAITTTDNEYYLDTKTDSIIRTNGGYGYRNWPKGPGSVKVVYTAGYATLPEDLQLAVFDLITYYHKKEYRGYKMLNGAATNAPGTTTQYRNVSFPDHIKRVLDLYKNVL